MKAMVFWTVQIFVSVVFAFEPIDHYGGVAIVPTPAAPVFWGTHWEGDGHALDISSAGAIQFNGETFADRAIIGSSQSNIVSGTHSVAGSRADDTKIFCTLIERSIELGAVDGESKLTLTERIYERESSSRGYLCSWFTNKKSYSLVHEATSSFFIDRHYVTMTGAVQGKQVTLVRYVDALMRQISNH